MASSERRWGWPLVAVLLVGGAGCIDLTRPSGRVWVTDAGSDGAVDAMAPGPDAGGDAPAMNPEDDPGNDAGPTPDAAAADARVDASDAAGTAACPELFRDDFEAGNLSGWDRTYTSLPTVTGTGAIAGARSLSTKLGTENAAGRTFAASAGVAFQFTVDLASMTTSGSIPMLAALLGSGLGYTPITVYMGRDTNGPLISVRAYVNAQTFERISFASLPAARVSIRIEWHAQTSTAAGVVRVLVNGAPFWTSPPLANPGARVDELRVGNTGGAGTGNVLYDDVLLERCQ